MVKVVFTLLLIQACIFHDTLQDHDSLLTLSGTWGLVGYWDVSESGNPKVELESETSYRSIVLTFTDDSSKGDFKV